MSQTEFWVGRVVKVEPQEGEDVELMCQRILKERGKELRYEETYLEELTDAFYKEFISYKGELYDFSGTKDIEEDEYLSLASKNLDGSIQISLRFYNGGTCLSEMFEEAMSGLTKEDK
jgi:hypothetical protein